ncbi:MAG TPA: hypothetical protein VGD52_22300 [Pseudoduganella sp.]
MKETRRPLFARPNWYWILQALGWTLILLVVVLVYSSFLGSPGVLATGAWTAASGALLSDLWHRVITARRWNTGAIKWRMFAGPVLLLGPLQALSVAGARPLLQGHFDSSFAWAPASFILWSCIFLGWQLAYMVALAIRRANRFEASAQRMEVQAKDADPSENSGQVRATLQFPVAA